MLYQVGVNAGWFTGSEPTPYESVFYSDFESFVSMESLRRAV